MVSLARSDFYFPLAFVHLAIKPVVATSLLLVARYAKKLACNRIASFRHGSKVRPPSRMGERCGFRASGAHRRSEASAARL